MFWLHSFQLGVFYFAFLSLSALLCRALLYHTCSLSLKICVLYYACFVFLWWWRYAVRFFDPFTPIPYHVSRCVRVSFLIEVFRTLFISFPALCSISHMFSRRPYWSSWQLGRIAGTFCAPFKFRFSTRFSFPLFAFLFPVLLPPYIVLFPCLLLCVFVFASLWFLWWLWKDSHVFSSLPVRSWLRGCWFAPFLLMHNSDLVVAFCFDAWALF